MLTICVVAALGRNGLEVLMNGADVCCVCFEVTMPCPFVKLSLACRNNQNLEPNIEHPLNRRCDLVCLQNFFKQNTMDASVPG